MRHILPDYDPLRTETRYGRISFNVDAKGGGGKGGSPDIPAPAPPAPKAETTKSLTAASTEARQSQKDKAARAAGLKSTILSNALTADGGAAGTGKTLLGQ